MLSERGRSRGMKYRTVVARQNWTSIWRQVVKRGKWKFRYFSSNIHLLYYSTSQQRPIFFVRYALTIDIEREKRYHDAIRATLMIMALRTFQSATFCSCFEVLIFPAILPSRRVAFLRLLFLCSLFFFVNPVSSSSCNASSEARWLNSTSSLVDVLENSELSSEEYPMCFPSPLGVPAVS